MKRTCISLAVVALLGSGAAQAYTATVTTTNNNFTMVGATNGNTGGTNDVTFTWDGTYRTSIEADGLYNAQLSSPTAFSGKTWKAHHVNVYAPGTYTFNTGCASGGAASTTYNPSCGTGPSYTLTVPAGKVGAHMLFNWSTSVDIDVVMLWDMNKSWTQTGTASPFDTSTNTGGNTVDTVWSAVSIDTNIDADAYSGTAMVDGPFIGQSANFSVNGITAADPAVTSNNPTGTGVGTGSAVTVVFDKAMNPATLTTASFTVKAGAGATVCGGSIAASNGNKTFTCTPTALAPSTLYTATVTTAAQSAVGVALASAYSWNFTTGASAATLSLSASGAAGTTTVSIPSGGSMASVGLLTSAQVAATPPANVTFSEGLVNYKITGVGGGLTVPVTIVFPASIAGKTLYKVDTTAVSPVYTAIPETAFTRVNSTTITMSITDCTAAPCTGYDTNATSGIIEDPIGAGTVVVTTAATLGAAPGGGGCAFSSNRKFDPTVLMMLLGSMGYLGWKRKQRD